MTDSRQFVLQRSPITDFFQRKKMDLENLLKMLMEKFREAGIEYVLSGGLALSAMGVVRFTKDIDFIIYEEDQKKVEYIMEDFGYERQPFSTDEIVSYWSPLKVFGQVVFLLARRKYTRAMMQRANMKPLSGGRLKVKTIHPEDLIGLKVQAMCNDPEHRSEIDKPDIKRLLKLHRKTMDMELVREYFRVFEKEEWLDGWLQEIES